MEAWWDTKSSCVGEVNGVVAGMAKKRCMLREKGYGEVVTDAAVVCYCHRLILLSPSNPALAPTTPSAPSTPQHQTPHAETQACLGPGMLGLSIFCCSWCEKGEGRGSFICEEIGFTALLVSVAEVELCCCDGALGKESIREGDMERG
jgi:hypothetical protein